jgi:hydrogenase expression/formation protein HypD
VKYVDEYRDPVLAHGILRSIRDSVTSRWVIMDVCGGQTHSLLRSGIDAELAESIELIHGPGCPVCVTPAETIDAAQAVARCSDVILTSFGDMLRVPGSRISLMEARSQGGSVRAVYSPLDALQLAIDLPHKQIVFFAVGFETTAPATALAVLQAKRLGLRNFSLLPAHVRVLPAMEAIAVAQDNRVQGFLGAGHVCTVTGYADYEPFAARFQLPVAITGFEPIDLLVGIAEVVRQLEANECQVVNCYERGVHRKGNMAAQALVEQVFEVADRPWRGFGVVQGGGFKMRDAFHDFDASLRFSPPSAMPVLEPSLCRSADVLTGRIAPPSCQAFGVACRPEHPLGAPMVSSEGACAAYFRFRSEHSMPKHKATYSSTTEQRFSP